MRSTHVVVPLLVAGLALSAAQADAQFHAAPTATTLEGVRFEPVMIPGGDFVPTLAEDAEGRMWFGTKEQGVVVYDGAGWHQFLHSPFDPGSIAFNYVEEVYVDRAGTVWVGTYGGGLDRFNPATMDFTHFRHDPANPASLSEDHVSAVFEDREGNFWVGTRGGLDRMDRQTGRFTHFAHDPADPTSISDNWIRAIYQDRAGTLWVGTQNQGLNRFDPATGTFTRYKHDPNDPTTLIAGMIGDIREDSGGRLWIGTGRPTGGLNLMDRERGTFTRFRFDPASTNWPANPSPQGPWTGGGVTSIAEDSSGDLWFGIWEKGWLTRFDPETGTATNFHVAGLNPAGLDAHPFALHQARDGMLWVASIYGGPLFRVNTAAGSR